jgi:hypothetical protein
MVNRLADVRQRRRRPSISAGQIEFWLGARRALISKSFLHGTGTGMVEF